MSQVVDARGLSCPEPVLLTRAALSDFAGQPISILVDAVTPRENVQRLLTNRGVNFRTVTDGDGWRIEITGQ